MAKTSRAHRILVFTSALVSALVSSVGTGQTITTVAGFTPGSFAATESGAATYSIPIQVPPGIAGIEPKLAINYSSQGGGGLLGMGGHLSGISSIDRCGRTIVQDGVGVGVTYGYEGWFMPGGNPLNDRYCLDGQRLVMVAGTAYGADGAEYRTDRESYTKVVSFGSAGNGPAYFRAWTKSGQIIEYGNSADSRIEATGKTSVRTYQVNRISDAKGNAITFTYEEDNPANPTGDFRPWRIEYAYNGSTPNAKVEFSYQTRTDVGQSYVFGSLISIPKRLINVKTYVGPGATTLVKDYRLAYDYSPNGGASRLKTVTECNPDPANTQCLPPVSFAWQNAQALPPFAAPTSITPVPSGCRPAASADFNGDRIMDQLLYCGSSLMVRYGNGTSFGTGTPISSWVPIAGDLNGDGLADLYNGMAILSTGSGFGAPSPWGEGAPGWMPEYSGMGDFDGDGNADVLVTTVNDAPPYMYVQYSNGQGFGTAIPISNALALIGIADLNGDGRADMYFSDGEALLATDTANQFPGGGFWNPSVPIRNCWWCTFSLGDVNGDGLADLMVSDGTQLYIQTNNGIGFSAPAPVNVCPSGCGATGWLHDVNGDGRADLIIGADYGMVLISQSGTPDLVTTITDSLGAATSITYAPLTDTSVYVSESGSAWPVRDRLPQNPMLVVASTRASNGIAQLDTGGNILNVGSSATYKYYGSKAHMKGGGSLGFRQIDATDSQGFRTTTTFRQDYPFQGLSLSTSKTQISSGVLLSRVTNSWTDTLLANPSNTGGYHRADLNRTVQESNDLDGTPLPTVTTTYTPHALGFGNVGSIVVSTPDGYSKTTTNDYTNDTTNLNWILGRLISSQVTSVIPSTALPPP